MAKKVTKREEKLINDAISLVDGLNKVEHDMQHVPIPRRGRWVCWVEKKGKIVRRRFSGWWNGISLIYTKLLIPSVLDNYDVYIGVDHGHGMIQELYPVRRLKKTK